jgi:hypothetical protein
MIPTASTDAERGGAEGTIDRIQFRIAIEMPRTTRLNDTKIDHPKPDSPA